jgi:hypothetical protein
VHRLVEAADLFAVAAYAPFTKTYEYLETDLGGGKELVNAWDFVVPVVSVGVAYDAIALGFGMPIGNEYRRAVAEELAAWRSEADELFRAYLSATCDARPLFEHEYSLAAGAFAVWGMSRWTTNRKPESRTLTALANPLGSMIVESFSNWWTSNP